MGIDRTSEIIREAGSPVSIRSGSTQIDTMAIPLPENEFVVPRDLDIPSNAWFHWEGKKYQVSKIERSQMGDILICIEKEPSSRDSRSDN